MSTEKNQIKHQASLEALKSDLPLTNLLKLHKQAHTKELDLCKQFINEHQYLKNRTKKMSYSQILKKYKEGLKDQIYDFSEKGWDIISYVITQNNFRSDGLNDTENSDYYERKKMKAELDFETSCNKYWEDIENSLAQ